MALPTIQITNQYPTQATGTPLSNGKVLADSVSLDLNGNPVGTLLSPSIVSTQNNALGLNGQSFVFSSGNLVLSLAGNSRILFQNPAGSGVMANISAMAAYSSLTNAVLPMMMLNPTAGLPSAKGFAANVMLGSPLPKCQIFADNSATVAMSGGTSLFPFQIPQGRNVYGQLTMFLNQGQSLGIQVPVLAAGTIEVSIYASETTI